MTAESSDSYQALQAQDNAIVDRFKSSGYELVAPAYLQPADIFLDRIGESIRGRTYVFTDMGGEELCLRPDLTLPACRVYLERYPKGDVEAKLCYNGPAFRYQPSTDASHPREFRQAGIENIGGTNRAQVETEVTALVVDAVSSAGLSGFRIRVGDLGLFDALVRALDIPERWRLRLHHFFWRPPVFRDLLRQLSTSPAGELDAREVGLIASLDLEDRTASEAQVASFLDGEGIPLEGARSLAEITERLMDRAADAKQTPLAPDIVSLFEAYLAVSGEVSGSIGKIAAIADKGGVDITDAILAARARFDAFEAAGIDMESLHFSAEFGRDLEYYTGYVFQIEVEGRGRAGNIAGGGRYDDLLQGLGAPEAVPAVGSAIHTDRLLAAVGGGSR